MCTGEWLFRCHGDAGVSGERPAVVGAIPHGVAHHLADGPPHSPPGEPTSPSAQNG